MHREWPSTRDSVGAGRWAGRTRGCAGGVGRKGAGSLQLARSEWIWRMSLICPNIRASFKPDDVGLFVRVLAERTGRSDESWEGQILDEGLDSVLDQPEALSAIMEGGGISAVPAKLTFYVMVRHALLEAGLDDVLIADYVATLVAEFGERGRANRIARHDDRDYRYLVDLVAEMEEENSERRQFLLRAHLGNYSLWLSGLFPDYVAARVERRGAPGFDYYDDVGSSGYRLASECDLADHYDLTTVYREVADGFQLVRRALNRISDRWFLPVATHPVERLLRQVADDFKIN